ncbi:hypothetical protein B0H10DRAFT_1646254, partial [Mycena sp. CBHHK59/15]
WITVYLPTLYHFFGTHEDPWELGPLGTEVAVLQSIVDMVYDDTTYEVKKGYKRHTLGVLTIRIVDNFFSSSKYVDKPKKVAQYAQWALRADGPGWYEVPSP